MNAFFFAEYGANAKLFGKSFSKSVPFIDRYNSPIKYSQHFENDVPVDKCTFGENNTFFGLPAKRVVEAEHSYTAYGSLFDGEVDATNSDLYHSGYQVWEGKSLEGNITVNGDLYLKGSVFLNGYTLTVTGSVYQSGYITTGGGSLDIGNNYELTSDARINLYEGGEVRVAKDFIMKSSKGCMSYGQYDYTCLEGGTVTGESISMTLSGDVNEDGSVDLKDVVAMRRALAGGWDLSINETAADVNKDGSFDLKDVVTLRRYLAGGWDIELK